MKYILTILLLVVFEKTFSQFINWSTGDEHSINGYEVQQSKDNVTWISIAPISKGLKNYVYPLPLPQVYYRVKANGVTNFYTAAFFVSSGTSNSSTITNAKVTTTWFTDKLTWTTTGETNLNYYLLEKSSGGAWTQVKQVAAKGNSNYTYSVRRSWFSTRPTYRIGAVYKDGAKGTPLTFK